MINPRHIVEFCDEMRRTYGAAFIENQLPKGIKIVGDYVARSGQVFSIMINVFNTRGDVQIYDASRRLVFTEQFTGNINNNTRITSFIQKSILSY